MWKEQEPSVNLPSNLLPRSNHQYHHKNFTALHETSAHDKGEAKHGENRRSKNTKHRWSMSAWLGPGNFSHEMVHRCLAHKGLYPVFVRNKWNNTKFNHETSGALDNISLLMVFRTGGDRDWISWPTGTHMTCAPSHRMCRRWWLPCSCGWCVLAGHRCGRGYHGTGLPVSLRPELSLDSCGLHDQRHCTGCKPGRSCTPELCVQVDGSCCRPVHWCSQQQCGLA